VLVGEAPGVKEDETGLPFVGRAGEVLEELLPEAGLNSERDAFITNIVRCRPPDYRNPEKNRKPEEDEIAFCRSYLCDQLKEIRPTVVVAMGGPAAQAILSTTEPITSIRGNPKWWGPYIMLPTFHPAYPRHGGGRGAMEILRADFRTIPRLLRKELVPEPEAKAEFWCSESFAAAFEGG
jgi:uracil-DNA glycosylase family 4